MGMGLAFSDAGRVADVLAKGANASNTSVQGLAQALSYTAPIAHSLGLSLESTVAIIGKFADAGIDASRAGTALNSVLSQFSDPASQFRESLSAIGITTNNFDQALRQLAEAGPLGSSAILAVGQEAGPALRALLNQGIGALDDLKGKLTDSAGSAARTAAIMQDNLGGAMNSLGSTWDSVKNVLGTPVLPVLKDAVNGLANSLRGFVSDGTVGKFGEAFAEAVRTSIKWWKDFIAQVDFQVIAASIQEFASKTGAVFTQIGEYASTAGNTVKLAYGVMAGGVNIVLAAIYGIGSVFSEIGSIVLTGVAKLRDGLASVTFGGLSESFRLAAEDARSAAEGFGDAAQAMRDKAADSMNDAANAARLAQDGFVGLAAATKDTGDSSSTAEEAIKSMAASIEAAGKAAEASGQKQSKAAKDAATEVGTQSARVKELRALYEKQMALGNLQGAAEALLQLDQAQRSVGNSAVLSSKQIEMNAASLAARNKVVEAGLNLSLSQERAHEATAQAAGNEIAVLQSKIRQKEIEIKIVQATVKAMNDEADAAIRVAEAKLIEMKRNSEQNLELEAELRNRIELGKVRQLEAKATATNIERLQAEITTLRNGANNTGNSISNSMGAARDAVSGVGDAALQAAGSFDQMGAAAEKAAKQVPKDNMGHETRTAGTSTGTRQGIIEWLKGAGLDEALAEYVSKDFVDANGNVAYMDNGGQKKWRGNSMDHALSNVVDYYKYGQGKEEAEAMAAEAAKQKAAKEAKTAPKAAPAASPAPAPSSSTSSTAGTSGSSGASYVSHNYIPGRSSPITLNYADADSQRAGDELMRQLASGKGVAQ